jgi:hypothetical protein
MSDTSPPWDSPDADPLADIRTFMRAAENGLTYGEIDEGGWDAVQARADGRTPGKVPAEDS